LEWAARCRKSCFSGDKKVAEAPSDHRAIPERVNRPLAFVQGRFKAKEEEH